MIRLKSHRKESRKGKITAQQGGDLAHNKVRYKSTFPYLGDSLVGRDLVRNFTEGGKRAAGLPNKLVAVHHCMRQ